ncbi:MAG: glycosyltransferase family 4 protein [Alphaproteobacteria bacterium]|nr:glycosyltransferase family 4 protein [Alphaproteobacteria bacterium]
MKIWLICQFFAPEPGAPSARLGGFASFWNRADKDVTVLTSMPNHPYGKVYDEYQSKGFFTEENLDGVVVKRHSYFMTSNEGIVLKALSQLMFAFVVLLKNLFASPMDRPDVIVVSSPSFFVAISAWLLSKRYKVPFVFEVRDIWPGIFLELGVLKRGFLYNTLEKIELFLYRRAAAIVTVTRGFGQDMINRGIDGSKIFIITNGVSEHDIARAEDTELDDKVARLRTDLQISPLSKVILYIGNHGVSQALGQVVDAARILMARTDFVFVFVGEGGDKERLKRIATGMPNVQFYPSQPKDKVWEFYHLSYACLVPLKDIKGFDTFIPSKMFEIMASGTPVLGCVRGEAAQIMEDSGAAVVLPPEEPEKLAQAIMNLVDDASYAERLSEAGPAYVKKKYSHALLAGQYMNILHQVTGLPREEEKMKEHQVG